jgi:alpha-N-arabinofuranosidase
MANYAPVVNTRGCICTGKDGIVLRSTYHVFDLYVNYMGDVIINDWQEDVPVKEIKNKDGRMEAVHMLDVLVSKFSDKDGWAIAVVNKEPEESRKVSLDLDAEGSVTCYYLAADSTESYNDFGHQGVVIASEDLGTFKGGMEIEVRPHTVSVIHIGV